MGEYTVCFLTVTLPRDPVSAGDSDWQQLQANYQQIISISKDSSASAKGLGGDWPGVKWG